MVGAIRKRNILAHPIVTIRCFGWAVFFRALFAPRGTTFLSVLADAEPARPAKKPWHEPIERCGALELRAKRIYQSFAERFGESDTVREFFTALTAQEQEHCDLLQLCSASLRRGHWRSELFSRCEKSLPGLEAHMHAAEKTAQLLTTLPEALELVLSLECSELNHIFQGVVQSSESLFVRRLRAFNAAGEDHLAYIARCLPQLDPALEDACRPLLDIHAKLQEANVQSPRSNGQ